MQQPYGHMQKKSGKVLRCYCVHQPVGSLIIHFFCHFLMFVFQDLLPLVFMFELPVTGILQPLPDASSPPIKSIQDTYGVTVTFKQRARVYMTTVIVRGTVNKAKAVKEATMRLIEHLTGNIGVGT